MILLGALLVLGTILRPRYETKVTLPTGSDSVAITTTQQATPEPKLLYGIAVNNLEVIEDEVKTNERFADLLEAHFVDEKVLKQISTLPKSVFDFRKVTARKKYTLLVENDSVRKVKALIYQPNPVDYYIFRLEDTLTVESGHRVTAMVEKGVSGEIKESLSHTIESMGISPELTNKFVDIFAWQVDFTRLRKGDKFKMVYNEIQVDGSTIGIGQIDGIYFEHAGGQYYAFPLDQGSGVDYFDKDGRSLRKAFLKYPIEFTRISSRFNLKRFHPVAKVFRAHRGTDFAAPVGTPIRSVGDGVIEEAQYKRNNGNYVKVRHNGTFTTQYLHMSRIASGIRAGTRVRQGQTIGFVGSTGLASGPHLCYRFWKNGVQVDALRVNLPPAEPVSRENQTTFELIKQDITRKLDLIPLPSTSGEITVVSN